MIKRPKILVTNDDGIFAPGIYALWEAMQEIGDVTIVAPDSEKMSCMHMHVMMGLEVSLRTTIEIRDEHRAKLLEMAARRGEKGFSSIVSEAIELLLQAQAKLDEARCRALEVRGSLGEREAEDLRKEVSQLRAEWR